MHPVIHLIAVVVAVLLPRVEALQEQIQMVEDVRLAVNGKVPVEFYGRMGGMVPDPEEILKVIVEKFEGVAV